MSAELSKVHVYIFKHFLYANDFDFFFIYEKKKKIYIITCLFNYILLIKCIFFVETCVFAYLGLAIFSFNGLIVKPALVIWGIVSSIDMYESKLQMSIN